jgi:hypothetical protein
MQVIENLEKQPKQALLATSFLKSHIKLLQGLKVEAESIGFKVCDTVTNYLDSEVQKSVEDNNGTIMSLENVNLNSGNSNKVKVAKI